MGEQYTTSSIGSSPERKENPISVRRQSGVSIVNEEWAIWHVDRVGYHRCESRKAGTRVVYDFGGVKKSSVCPNCKTQLPDGVEKYILLAFLGDSM